jgi:hypothetical protein
LEVRFAEVLEPSNPPVVQPDENGSRRNEQVRYRLSRMVEMAGDSVGRADHGEAENAYDDPNPYRQDPANENPEQQPGLKHVHASHGRAMRVMLDTSQNNVDHGQQPFHAQLAEAADSAR